MDFAKFGSALRKYWGLVALLALAGGASALIVNHFTAKVYEATAQIFVSTQDASTSSDLALGNTFTQARVQSYTDVATSPQVTEPVIAQLDLKLSNSQLADKISADAPQNKVIINLHVTDGSASQAAELANAVAKSFQTVVQQIEVSSAAQTSPVKLTIIQPAQTPTTPVEPRAYLNLVLGLLLGLVIGLGAGLLREILDNTFKSPEALAVLSDLPVLTVAPLDRRAASSAVAFKADPHGGRAEAFRQLRTNLQFVDVDQPPRVLAITSAMPGEGKTHSAVNLAAALAEAGQRVCLIEADLRRPTLSQILGIVGTVGLTSVLIGRAQIEDVLQNVGQNFAVMTSGPVPPNPSELLASDLFRDTLAYIADRVDMVIVDTAPLLPVSDGAEVSSRCEATVLVVRAARTTRDQVRRALEALRNVEVVPVGAVLSMASTRGRRAAYSYYYANYAPNVAVNESSDEVDAVDGGVILARSDQT